MLNYLKTLISSYGQSIAVTFTDASSKSKLIKSRAFIQPLRSDEQSPLYGDYNSSNTTEQFLYIGKADVKLYACPEGTLIETASGKYKIKKAENVCLGKKVIYERAVLEVYSNK